MSEQGPAWPLLVVAQAHPAAGFLRSLMAADGTVACTESTGLLPLCDRAVLAWRLAEGRSGPPSALAVKSLRSMISMMRAVVLARLGGQQWCEISTASVQAAEAFLCLYPEARIACLYCHVTALTGTPDRSGRPGRPDRPGQATLLGQKIWLGADELSRASYWTVSAAAMLAFEQKYPANCQRFRYEDFIERPRSSLSELRAFFCLPGQSPGQREPWPLASESWPGAGTGPSGTAIQRKELPPELHGEVERILAALDYAE